MTHSDAPIRTRRLGFLWLPYQSEARASYGAIYIQFFKTFPIHEIAISSQSSYSFGKLSRRAFSGVPISIESRHDAKIGSGSKYLTRGFEQNPSLLSSFNLNFHNNVAEVIAISQTRNWNYFQELIFTILWVILFYLCLPHFDGMNSAE